MEDLENVKVAFGDVPNVTVVALEYNDSWLRDTGPTFLVNRVTGHIAGVDWKFNCWGEMGKGEDVGGLPFDKDCTVAAQILAMESHTVHETFKAPFVMEGGKKARDCY